jgi:antitoxin (DNA-binding transcriptional repressor) of toxin-antitoxin stability system
VKTLNSSEFKAKCLAILDEVERTGEIVVVLKRGRPIAQLSPIVAGKGKFPQDSLIGTVEVLGDILEPVLPPEAWEAEGSDEGKDR